jgi:hypothetical protein
VIGAVVEDAVGVTLGGRDDGLDVGAVIVLIA